jgi:DNA-binding NarL/FixJ family response regulator
MPESQGVASLERSWRAGAGEAIRIVVVAPALALRAGLRALLNALDQVEVIGEAASLAGLEPLPAGTDILVLTAEAAGQADLKQALLAAQTTAVLLLAADETEAAQVLPGLPARAWGVLPLDTSAEELAAAVHALSEGLSVGAPGLVEPLFLPLSEAQKTDSEPLVEPLTERESEVLQLLAQGQANKQIAVSLGISEHTVKFHISAIYAKLGAASRTEAVRIGVHKGLIVL